MLSLIPSAAQGGRRGCAAAISSIPTPVERPLSGVLVKTEGKRVLVWGHILRHKHSDLVAFVTSRFEGPIEIIWRGEIIAIMEGKNNEQVGRILDLNDRSGDFFDEKRRNPDLINDVDEAARILVRPPAWVVRPIPQKVIEVAEGKATTRILSDRDKLSIQKFRHDTLKFLTFPLWTADDKIKTARKNTTVILNKEEFKQFENLKLILNVMLSSSGMSAELSEKTEAQIVATERLINSSVTKEKSHQIPVSEIVFFKENYVPLYEILMHWVKTPPPLDNSNLMIYLN